MIYPQNVVWYIESRPLSGERDKPSYAPANPAAMGSGVVVEIEQLDKNREPFDSRKIRKYLLTCAHVVRQSATDGAMGWGAMLEEIHCWQPGLGYSRTYPNSRRSGKQPGVAEARVSDLSPCGAMLNDVPCELRSPNNDWVFLDIQDPDFQTVPSVRQWSTVAPGVYLKIIGFPGGAGRPTDRGRGHFWDTTAIVQSVTSEFFRQTRTPEHGLLKLDGPDETRPGMSGGGVFDAQGRFVGIHRSSTDVAMEREGVSAAWIKEWLFSHRNARPVDHDVTSEAFSAVETALVAHPDRYIGIAGVSGALKQIQETIASLKLKQLDVYQHLLSRTIEEGSLLDWSHDRAAHYIPPVHEIPQRTLLCEEVPAGKSTELSTEPMLSRKAFTTIAEARRYGFLGDRVKRFIEKEFDPNNSYLFHSPPKTGKSSLLMLLVCAAEDRIIADRGPYIFLTASHNGGPDTSPDELFRCLEDYQQRCQAMPVLLIDNINAQIGLHKALLALKKEKGGLFYTPIWATAVTDSVGMLVGKELGAAFKQVKEPLPGLLDTRHSGVLSEFFEKIRELHGPQTASIFQNVVRERDHVSVFYLSELSLKGKPFISNPKALERELMSVDFDVREIFQGIYGLQSNIGRSAVSIVCHERGMSRFLLDAITSRAAGIDCHAEIEKLFAANILWTGIATELSAGKPSVEFIDGIQDVALMDENFPPAHKREMTRYMIGIEPSDRNFGEAILRLDRRFLELSTAERRTLCDALLASNSEQALLVASRRVDFDPRLLSLWRSALSNSNADGVWPEILSGFGLKLLELKRGPDAIKCFAEAAKISDRDHRVILNLARGYAECQMWDDALREYERGLRMFPTDRDAVAGYWRSLERRTNLQLLRAKLEALAGEFPQSAWLMKFTGMAWAEWDPKDWGKAVYWVEKAIRLKPEEREIGEFLVSALIEAVGVEETRAKLETLTSEFPQSAWLMYGAGLAWAGMDPKDWGKAVYWFEKAIRLKPDERGIGELLVSALGQSVGLEETRAKLETLMSEFPQSAWLMYGAGLAWAGMDPKDWGKAVYWFEKAIRLKPDEREIFNLFYSALIEAVGVEKTRAKLETLTSEFPQSAWLMYGAGLAWAGMDPKDWGKAVYWFEKAIRLKPDERKIGELLVSALIEAVGVEETRAKLETLTSEFPQSAWLMYGAGLAWAGMDPKDWGKAVYWFEKAIRLKPDEREIFNLFYSALIEAVGVEKTRAKLETLTSEFPQSAWLMYGAGLAWAGRDPTDWGKAVYWFEKAIRLKPDERKIFDLFYSALIEALGVEKTRAKLETLTSEFPQSAWLMYGAGLAWAGTDPKDWGKAVYWFEKAIRLKPDEREILNLFYSALKNAVGVEETRAKLETLTSEFPWSAWLMYGAGLAWAGTDPKDWGKAVYWFEKAIRLKPDEREIFNLFYSALKNAVGVEETRAKLETLTSEFPWSAWLIGTPARGWPRWMENQLDLAKFHLSGLHGNLPPALPRARRGGNRKRGKGRIWKAVSTLWSYTRAKDPGKIHTDRRINVELLAMNAKNAVCMHPVPIWTIR